MDDRLTYRFAVLFVDWREQSCRFGEDFFLDGLAHALVFVRKHVDAVFAVEDNVRRLHFRETESNIEKYCFNWASTIDSRFRNPIVPEDLLFLFFLLIFVLFMFNFSSFSVELPFEIAEFMLISVNRTSKESFFDFWSVFFLEKKTRSMRALWYFRQIVCRQYLEESTLSKSSRVGLRLFEVRLDTAVVAVTVVLSGEVIPSAGL